ncbi:MAG: hypothetical protein OEO79_07065 [Gemmatimonadota bacterium]|nr:hypothetical protein [Gemmatimonadota bacterium]MDH3422505.1 hypothetical protein [Gemmatimonadota bacterium]
MSERLRAYLAVPYLLALAACGGPIGILAGGALEGEEGTAGAWSEVVSGSGTLDLETRPEDPYSVRIGFVFRDGEVYIDPAEGRRWYEHLKADPSVRVRIDDRIYRARAVAVTDPIELEGFDPERHVQRLELVGRNAN